MKVEKPEEKLMRQALRLAKKAAEAGEVPVGALVVRGPLDVSRPRVIARAGNQTHTRQDPTGHAELIALRRAAKKLGTWRLTDCTLIVTLEPCAMCAGAAVWSRIGKVIWGADDPKAGAAGSALNVLGNKKLNHRPPCQKGVLAEDCGEILKEFFKARRALEKKGKQA